MPDYKNIRIIDQVEMKEIYAHYSEDIFGNRAPVKDFGILTVMRNPMNEAKVLVGCMGIHGFGSLACFKVLSDRILLRDLMQIIDLPLKISGYQVLVEYEKSQDRITILSQTLHKF